MLFKRIAVANRGEIAVRVVRACRELGIEVAVLHSDVDADSMAVRLADAAISIGDVWAYLDGELIIEKAAQWGAQAIHPGYGFLAENSEFARSCQKADIAFVGPDADVMDHLGQKDKARASAMDLNIPCLPGTQKPIAGVDEAVAVAAETGYPVLIKAVAGGGGRGMRLAENEEQLRDVLPRAVSEAQAAFGSSEVYVEKYLTGARHVEVQVMSDSHGNVVHLGERDCTVQRRHQKLIEESPSPALSDETRQKMTEDATRLLKELGYVNAGTVEFLVDDKGNYYFLEVNTRIQVEHPVTEMLYGVDLIAEQIRIAAGKPLSWNQKQLQPSGWVIECRINAEDPVQDFMPRPGVIGEYIPPAGPGVRVDSAVGAGIAIAPHYDSMIAKVIVQGADRESAIARMQRALHEFYVDGVPTTIPFHLAVLDHPIFVAGRFSTTFIETSIRLADLKVAEGQQDEHATEAKSNGNAAVSATSTPSTVPTVPAAVASAVASVMDGPHRIVSVFPTDRIAAGAGPAAGNFWGTAGRLDLMQRRAHAVYPRRDRRM